MYRTVSEIHLALNYSNKCGTIGEIEMYTLLQVNEKIRRNISISYTAWWQQVREWLHMKVFRNPTFYRRQFSTFSPAIFVQKSKERDGMEPIYFPLFQDKDYVSPLTTLGEDRALKGWTVELQESKLINNPRQEIMASGIPYIFRTVHELSLYVHLFPRNVAFESTALVLMKEILSVMMVNWCYLFFQRLLESPYHDETVHVLVEAMDLNMN